MMLHHYLLCSSKKLAVGDKGHGGVLPLPGSSPHSKRHVTGYWLLVTGYWPLPLRRHSSGGEETTVPMHTRKSFAEPSILCEQSGQRQWWLPVSNDYGKQAQILHDPLFTRFTTRVRLSSVVMTEAGSGLTHQPRIQTHSLTIVALASQNLHIDLPRVIAASMITGRSVGLAPYVMMNLK